MEAADRSLWKAWRAHGHIDYKVGAVRDRQYPSLEYIDRKAGCSDMIAAESAAIRLPLYTAPQGRASDVTRDACNMFSAPLTK